jgi:hypothetical protein
MDKLAIEEKYSSIGFTEIDYLKLDDWIGIAFKK